MSAIPATRSPLALARLAARRATLRARAWQRWRHAAPGDFARIGAGERIPFRCNVCGTGNESTLHGLDREAITCTHCGSSVRFRAMVYLLTKAVLGEPVSLTSLRARKDIGGIGLSDAWSYAHRLAAKFDYVNTYFHDEPRLDICDVASAHLGRYDFVLSSDVFEHVRAPVRDALVNARRMLKPAGKLILTVPLSIAEDTVEHYPDLHDYRIDGGGSAFTLTNVTRAGATQVFTDLVFHGGPGSTLEMRVFSRAALIRDLLDAGFSRVDIADESYLPFGIHWPDRVSVPLVAHA